jgi:Salmonella virulence plasmid 65kDa B protein
MRSKTRFFLLGPVLVSSALVSLMAAGSALAAPTPIVLQTPHLTNANAGTLSGSLEVDNDGASTYSIEVPVPPGTGGMTPRLALSYSSQGSNGMVGLGWSLQGLSTIHRCQKTIAQDGVPGRIRFNNADRLCLDGQRLLRISGTNPGTNVSAIDNAYWSTFGNDTQYRTEQESFRRVSRLTGGGFKVEGKDGRILYYGSTSSGLIKAQGRADGDALVWALDRVEDRVGNYLTVEYSQDTATGEYLPKQIRYGGNTAAVPAQAQDLAVRFVYETRADAQVAYVGGSRNDLRSRLTRIQSYTGTATNGTGGTLVREHAIRYLQSTSSGRSLVESIQACALNPQSGQNECLPKTSFEWGQAALAYREEAQFSSWQKSTGLPQTSVHLRADFDGDGLLDDMFLRVCEFPSITGRAMKTRRSRSTPTRTRYAPPAGCFSRGSSVFLVEHFPPISARACRRTSMAMVSATWYLCTRSRAYPRSCEPHALTAGHEYSVAAGSLWNLAEWPEAVSVASLSLTSSMTSARI